MTMGFVQWAAVLTMACAALTLALDFSPAADPDGKGALRLVIAALIGTALSLLVYP